MSSLSRPPGNAKASEFALNGRRRRGERHVVCGDLGPKFGGAAPGFIRRGLGNFLSPLGHVGENHDARRSGDTPSRVEGRSFPDFQNAARDRKELGVIAPTETQLARGNRRHEGNVLWQNAYFPERRRCAHDIDVLANERARGRDEFNGQGHRNCK